MFQRAKKFIQRFQEVASIVSKLSQLVGDGLDVIKVVDSVVDSFIEERKNGKLKDVDFFEYAMAVCNLISAIADVGEPLGDVVSNIVSLFETSQKIKMQGMSKADSIKAVKTIVNNAFSPIEE